MPVNNTQGCKRDKTILEKNTETEKNNRKTEWKYQDPKKGQMLIYT